MFERKGGEPNRNPFNSFAGLHIGVSKKHSRGIYRDPGGCSPHRSPPRPVGEKRMRAHPSVEWGPFPRPQNRSARLLSNTSDKKRNCAATLTKRERRYKTREKKNMNCATGVDVPRTGGRVLMSRERATEHESCSVHHRC